MLRSASCEFSLSVNDMIGLSSCRLHTQTQSLKNGEEIFKTNNKNCAANQSVTTTTKANQN